MDFWRALLWGLILVGGAAAVYGFHRLGLWLEERGWLYYKHKKPNSSPASCFLALQKALEPQTQYVLQIKDEKRHRAEEDVAREGDPTASGSGNTSAPDKACRSSPTKPPLPIPNSRR
jgi:hypothetical protein